ncbi:TerB family tellurite resistance protein [Brevibacillus composti]|uniref:TerB family tellurite resistance protein n=1 Tax=Brevibacillus composti TaxID=2796470 RepID=A0A7T5EPW1_9BACL|nr:TerB family tellurite resistance protein [Brevibacillus composti]QQE76527.1 TerB family tellurite resistance protein [Brevibacillus composti]QUO43600.1 TerB family tellurite resistance protein [Brevibacillus composti]
MELLTKTEKDKHILFASIRLMICVGHADGYIGMKEVDRIHELVNSEHFTLRERQILMDDMDYPKQPETIIADMVDLSHAEKLTLLRQLFKIALIDQKLSSAETKEIRRISGLLGISEDKLHQVEEWILEGIAWRDRWKLIIDEE